jgi:hypothetical protein
LTHVREAGKVALGFRTHSGWAAAVAVSGSVEQPVVLERRRILIARGPRQPYHAAEPLAFAEAEVLIRKCREGALDLAVAAVEELRREFGAKCAGVLVGRPRPVPALADILKSHAAIHTAEGVFYREVMIEACERSGLRVMRVPESEVAPNVADLPKLGPPWTADEKLATLAALISLSPRGAASSGS